MSFRQRLTLAAAIAVAIAVALAAALSYVLVRDQLRGQVDDALSTRATRVEQIGVPDDMPGSDYFGRLPHGRIGDDTLLQFVTDSGIAVRPGYEQVALPVSARTREVASGQRHAFYADDEIGNAHVRILTMQLRPGLALQLVRSLDEVDHVLGRLGLILTLVGASGVGVAVALGGLVAHAALRPVRRLSEVTEHVAATRDLSQRLEETGRDELGRLARSFNTMLAALEESQRAQRQLVADASHELRTPLTALRTNVELLANDGLLDASEDDAAAEGRRRPARGADRARRRPRRAGARGDQPRRQVEDVRLDLLVAAAVERARRDAPQVDFETRLEEPMVSRGAGRLDRAVANLLDNAAKWIRTAPSSRSTCADGEVTVRDFGPGIADDDIPFVFDRFYRATDGARHAGLRARTGDRPPGRRDARRLDRGRARARRRLPVPAAPAEGAGDRAGARARLYGSRSA